MGYPFFIEYQRLKATGNKANADNVVSILRFVGQGDRQTQDSPTFVLHNIVSEKVVVGCREPSVAIRVTVDVVPGTGSTSEPQPVHMLSPAPMIPASISIRAPRRFLHPKQQNASAIAEPGSEVLELWLSAVFSAAVAIVSVVVATAPAGVTELGENLQDAPAGKPEQLNETADEYPFTGVTRMVAVPLCPGVTVNADGRRETPKLAVSAFTV
jgi:hypothetical protein